MSELKNVKIGKFLLEGGGGVKQKQNERANGKFLCLINY